MDKEVLRSKVFIKKLYYYIFLGGAAAVGLGILDLLIVLGGVFPITAIFTCAYFLPWSLLNLFLMWNIICAVHKFKGGTGFRLICFLFMIGIVVVSLCGLCSAFACFAATLSDIISVYSFLMEPFAGVIVISSPFLYILQFLPTTAVFLLYLLLEHISWNNGYDISAMPLFLYQKPVGIIGYLSSYIGMILVYWLPLYYSFAVLISGASGVMICWFITYVIFISISFYVIRYLCQQEGELKYYRYAKLNTLVLSVMWVCELVVLVLWTDTDSMIIDMALPLVLLLSIPALIMMILFFKAKRMGQPYPSEMVEIVSRQEFAERNRVENVTDWEAEGLSDSEPGKKSESWMETDY